MHEQLNEWPDPQGVQHGSDTHGSSEHPTGCDDNQLDTRPNEANREPRSCDKSGHQAVPWTGTHSCADVQGRRERIDDDAGRHHGRSDGNRVESREPSNRQVDCYRDHHDIADGSQSWLLSQRNPGEQHSYSGRCGDRSETQWNVQAQALVQYIPRIEPEPRSDHQRHRESVQTQTHVERYESWPEVDQASTSEHRDDPRHPSSVRQTGSGTNIQSRASGPSTDVRVRRVR